MRRTITTAIAAVLASSASLAMAQHPANHAKARAGAKKSALICPVTGDHIASVRKAAGRTTFNGKTYYFCCAGCKPRFDKSPAKFAKNAAKGKFEKM